MGEGHAYSTYELPFWKLIKYLGICLLAGFVAGEVSRYSSADYLIALWLWRTFIVAYWYVTLPAVALMMLVSYVFRKKKTKLEVK